MKSRGIDGSVDWVRRLLIVAFALGAALASALPATAGDNEFVSTASLTDGRWSHLGVRLSSGRVLVAGGWGPIGGGYVTIKSSSELYDPASGSWTPSGEMTIPRANPVYSVLADGRVFVAGGESVSPERGLELVRSIEIYDPASGAFAAAGELPFFPVSAQSLADGRVLALDGAGAAVLYDPVDASSVETGHALRGHGGGTQTLLADGRVLFAGGQNALDLAEIYDPTTGAFTRVGNMTIDRVRHSATLLADGRVLVVGGIGGFVIDFFTRELASVEVFDPATEAFTAMSALPQPRLDHAATLLANATVLLTGGRLISGGGTRSDAELYDPASGSSGNPIPMRAARNAHTALLLGDGSVLVAGGTESPQTAERFFEHYVDTFGPSITVPADITTLANSASGAEVGYTASATDDSDPNPALNCTPVSGSVFPIGTTTVTCTATDSSGNAANASFAVVVLPPLELTVKLDPVASIQLRSGAVTVHGTVTCNRDQVLVFVAGELTQTHGRTAAIGSYFAEATCADGKGKWTATLTPSQGSFKPGLADATGITGGCDNLGSCAEAKAKRSLLLLPTLAN